MDHLTQVLVLLACFAAESKGLKSLPTTTVSPATAAGPVTLLPALDPPPSSLLPAGASQTLLSGAALQNKPPVSGSLTTPSVSNPVVQNKSVNNGYSLAISSQNVTSKKGHQITTNSNTLTQQTLHRTNPGHPSASQLYTQPNMYQQHQMNLNRVPMYSRVSMVRNPNPNSLSLPALYPPSSPRLPLTSSVPASSPQTSFAPSPLTIFLQMVTFISRVQAAKDLKCKTISELLGMDVPVYFPMSCDDGKCPPGRVCRQVGSVGFCCAHTVTDGIIAFRGLMGTAKAMQTGLSSL